MRIYVINLARSPERREHMVRQFEKTGVDYEFVEGIEGRDLDLGDTRLVNPIWLGRSPLWPGTVGGALSHLKVYRKILEDGADRALVLEDDVILPTDLRSLVEATAALMTGAEAVLLQYFSYFSAERGEPFRLNAQGSLPLPGSRVVAVPIDMGDPGGAGAYLMTRDACERMTSAFPPVKAPADDWGFFCNEGVLESVRCVVPGPVRSYSGFRTTIDHHAHGSLQTRLRETAIRTPLLRRALTRRRQRIMDRQCQVELVDGPSI